MPFHPLDLEPVVYFDAMNPELSINGPVQGCAEYVAMFAYPLSDEDKRQVHLYIARKYGIFIPELFDDFAQPFRVD